MEKDTVTPFVERVFLFLEDGEWNKASEYCERILDADPKNAYAYLGKLMVELRIKRKSDFSTCKNDFEQDTNYRRIIQFGDPTIIAEIKGYLAQAKRKNQTKITKNSANYSSDYFDCLNYMWRIFHFCAQQSGRSRRGKFYNIFGLQRLVNRNAHSRRSDGRNDRRENLSEI